MYRFSFSRPRGVIQWFIAAIVAFWVLQFAGAFVPASVWYEVGRVEVVEPVYAGEEIHLSVNRKVKRSFDGEYDVVVVDEDTNTIVCDGGATLRYDPSRSLPKPVTLEWWIGEPCELDIGNYHMISRWKIEWSAFELLDKRVSVDTYFSVLPSDDANLPAPEPLIILEQSIQLEEQRGLIEGLQRQVETLSQEVLK